MCGKWGKEAMREDSVEEISSVWTEPTYREEALGKSRKAFVMG